MVSSSVWACSCRDKSVGEVAHSKDIILTKLRINYPSLAELIRSYFDKPTYSKSYSVTVLKNYKGTFNGTNITASTVDGETDCSRRVSYGETLLLIVYTNSEKFKFNDVNVCTITSEKFAEEVQKENASPSFEYKPVDTSDWIQIHKSATQSFYADTKNVTKDVYGSYIWMLMNDSAMNNKSHKYKVQIACKEKMYFASHDVVFSKQNANGDVLRGSADATMNSKKWLPLNDLYSKLLKYACS
jgi:hypothetical protein